MPAIDVQKPRENKGFAQTNQAIYYRFEPEIRQSTASSYSFILVGSYPKLENKHYESVNTKLIDVNNAWAKEYEKYCHYIKGDSKVFDKNIKLVNSIISAINYDDFDIELTPSSTIVYSLLLPDKKLLIITKSFQNDEDKAENDVVFSIFDNKKLILSDIKDLNELVSGINEYTKMQSSPANWTA